MFCCGAPWPTSSGSLSSEKMSKMSGPRPDRAEVVDCELVGVGLRVGTSSRMTAGLQRLAGSSRVGAACGAAAGSTTAVSSFAGTRTPDAPSAATAPARTSRAECRGSACPCRAAPPASAAAAAVRAAAAPASAATASCEGTLAVAAAAALRAAAWALSAEASAVESSLHGAALLLLTFASGAAGWTSARAAKPWSHALGSAGASGGKQDAWSSLSATCDM
mmetsp:Transcript_78784/g.243068  ORF Transcript_78784/g.243068 Transcript_78784/m.243068 type:complete len:221 (+) Transcript_78784:151-813(+)